MDTTTPIALCGSACFRRKNAVFLCYLDDRDSGAVTRIRLLCASLVDDFPDATGFVVSDVEPAVGSFRQTDWAGGRGVWLLGGAGKSVRRSLAFGGVRRLPARKWTEPDVVPFLRARCAFPSA